MALEFDLIENFFKPLSLGLSEDEVGIGDDGAVMSAPEGHQLVVVTDTLVAGVHFPVATSAYDIAWKALAVNLSDLAAMGATPAFFSLALTLPENDTDWLKGFSKGLKDLSHRFKIPLIGGDTTKGPLTITVTANGWVPFREAILRSGAKVGDWVCVTNTVGDGALGLKVALDNLPESMFISDLSQEEKKFALNALNRPMPQLAISQDLLGRVNSAIDISDGLLADLGHILQQSSAKSYGTHGASQKTMLGADIELTELPLSSGVTKYLELTDDWSLPLAGGDDYQLCLTLDEARFSGLKALLAKQQVCLTKVGKINDQGLVSCFERGVLRLGDADLQSGYSHF
ncbi:MAG: thiamine-monophosphate kinase [Thiomicrorhabdus sp.]|nr:MAG: thiamine-monophosphate kinase [Thiomicrorhabdus sp.]